MLELTRLRVAINAVAFLLLLGCFVVVASLSYVISDLPTYEDLANYSPNTITRFYSNSGRVVAEYAEERRIFSPYEEIPKLVIGAFLAAEDKNFFSHQGIDLIGLARAIMQNIVNIGMNRRLVGASTVTQQVVQALLLNKERTIDRKLKEAVLSYRISNAYTKEHILELYLNQIFLGNNAYGVAEAARAYFDKELDELTVAEAAMLAALPKAPSNLNPLTNPKGAIARRNWVLERMAEDGIISQSETYKQEPLVLRRREVLKYDNEDFYSEATRLELIQTYGEEALMREGLIVNLNLDEKLQKYANDALHRGLIAYDKRHGWRGPIGKIKTLAKWEEALSSYIKPTEALPEHKIAVVLKSKKDSAEIGLSDGKTGIIRLEDLAWAQKNFKNSSSSAVLNPGDVILVLPRHGSTYTLEQIPIINGAIVVQETYTGKVLAMVGGWVFNSHGNAFNRAVQAKRQPGSAFKMLVYLAALESGFTPESILLDEPIVLSMGYGMPDWKPKNYKDDYLGPISLATAFAKSRNVPTIRLVLDIGLKKIAEVARRLEVYNSDSLKKVNYSFALGTLETNLLQLTNAFNIIASCGYYTQPRFIDSVYDRDLVLLASDDTITCDGCSKPNAEPSITCLRPRLISSNKEAEITRLLRDAVLYGTAARARTLPNAVAGKTGTTNESKDTWFIGFSSDFTVGVYAGMDEPTDLGKRETGSTVAVPIFIDFMSHAMKGLEDRGIGSQNNSSSMNIIDPSGDEEEIEAVETEVTED